MNMNMNMNMNMSTTKINGSPFTFQTIQPQQQTQQIITFQSIPSNPNLFSGTFFKNINPDLICVHVSILFVACNSNARMCFRGN